MLGGAGVKKSHILVVGRVQEIPQSGRSDLTVLPPLEKKKSSAGYIWNVTGFSAFLDRCHDLEQFYHLIFFCKSKMNRYVALFSL
jgi:hypothetical protein